MCVISSILAGKLSLLSPISPNENKKDKTEHRHNPTSRPGRGTRNPQNSYGGPGPPYRGWYTEATKDTSGHFSNSPKGHSRVIDNLEVDRLREEDAAKEEEKRQGKLLRLQGGQGGDEPLVVGWAGMVVRRLAPL